MPGDLELPIPYGRQWIDEDDINAVIETLRGDWITQGPKVEEFEKSLAEYVGVKYAVVFNSGTSALHAAYFAAGVGEGDEVITSPITFVATANAAVMLGARVVFADIDMKTYCLDAEEVEKKITHRTRVVAPVSFAGYPVDLRPFLDLKEKYGFIIVEDAAHALGAIRNGKKVGAEADMTIFSFHPVKHITTGEGGVVVTNSEIFYEKLNLFRTHGITKSEEKLTRYDGPWYYEQHVLGYNYRITDFQCALGISQLRKLERFVERRNEIAKRYNEAFSEIDNLITPPKVAEEGWRHAYHIYPLLLNGLERKSFFFKLRERKILPQVHYIPVHLQPFYQERFGYREGDFPNAEDYYKREVTIPLFPRMSDAQVEYVINTVIEIASEG